jgi:anti-anti-sigma factor
MIPQGVEVRPELQVRSDVLAFGFSGERVADQTAVSLLGGALSDYLLMTAESAPTGLVVVDLRNVHSLSATGLGHLLALQKRLGQVRWQLALLISDPVTREVFSTTRLDHRFLVAANEAELRELVNGSTPVPAPSLSPEEPLEFSASELAEMEAAGITLDDAIQAIEGLRR